MDLIRASQRPLKDYLRRVSGAQPCVLAVDPRALELVAPFLGEIWSQHLAKNVVSLADDLALSEEKNDPLCRDVGGVSLVVALVTSLSGESRIERLQETLPADITLRVASFVEQPGCDFVPACIIPRGPSLFELTVDPCSGPLPAFLGSNKPGPYELDLDTDMSSQYRASLKRVATSLAVALSAQFGVDVSEAIYSLGFGGSLVANTLAAHLNDAQYDSQSKASLLILDRFMDVYSPLSEDARLEEVYRVHDELLLSGQATGVPSHIVQLLIAKAISPQKAFSLLLRAASLCGAVWESGDLDVLADQLGVESRILTKVCSDLALSRQDCLNDKDATAADEWFRGMQTGDVPVFERIVRQSLDIGGALPAALHRAKTFDVTNVARNIFGSVFGLSGGESDSNTQDMEIRRRPTLIIFVLGGLTSNEARVLIEAALVDYHLENVIIGGSSVFSQVELESDLLDRTRSSPSPPSENEPIAKSKDFGGFFS